MAEHSVPRSPPSPPIASPRPTPATLTDLESITTRLERQLLLIKDRSFNRVHRKIDAVLAKMARGEDVFREFGIVKRAVAGVAAAVKGSGQLTTKTVGDDEVVLREMEAVRQEVRAVRAVVINQWVRRLEGQIVRVPPARSVRSADDKEKEWVGGSAFPETVRDFWRLGDIEMKASLIQLAELYAGDIGSWEDWRRVERNDPSAARFLTLQDAVTECPMRCLRVLAAAWGLAFDLLERPSDVAMEVGGVQSEANRK
ncbi:hypothetical protein AJ79_01979 [Helicocarpus griseus UAMH5409]|uniref:Uncharacterized protein n=1 Tax=Helicocarpus griseus UAMH5409 TaxID=1447875 RepID=A0A2B7Y4Q4_9EURO|nr:hypothetical protein AJ79_01979 [Helicocarpus griseus UAMH5409]